jgi:glycosyltransferase involved in cell wall biosynthesis
VPSIVFEEFMPSTEEPLTGVSYVMPVLNEVEHIEAAINGITAQDYRGPYEVLVAVGPSVDGTNDVLAALEAADPRIRMLENPPGSTPGGLNIGIRAAKYPVVIRVDAHSVLPTDYTSTAVRVLEETGADNVGGMMKAIGRTSFEKAVAHVYSSREGLGGTRLHVGGKAGPAETVYLGVFRRDKLLEVGMFAEDIKRGQDWELNHRIRTAGGTVWFTPELVVEYRPRSNLRKLIRQFVATGIWRGELARRFTTANSLRYFIPPIAVLGIVATLVVGIVGLAIGQPWLTLAFIVPAVYLVLVIVSAANAARLNGLRAGLWYLVVLPCIHFAWGIGFLLAVLGLTRNITQHTGR